MSASELQAMARDMADAITHRGPDDCGAWVEVERGVAFGHRRLSIIDLSERGHQPMLSASGRFVASYNGEIYNFEELRRRMSALGHSFRGSSDTEVLLAAVEQWGVAGAAERFHGMFAFAIWDRQLRRLHLARDRIGEKPVYYGWQGSWFLFGSELNALRRHPAWIGEIDRDALTLFFRYGCIPAPQSAFRGISKVVPGTIVTIDPLQPDSVESRTYWSARGIVEAGIAAPSLLSPEQACAELERLLLQTIRREMVADVPLGAFLSGGIDSSTVVALMQEQSSRPVRTYTIGFVEPEFNEAEHARAVARHLGTEHTELYVTPGEAMEVIPELPRIYDEPFADPSQIPTYLVSRLARQSVTVALSGDGGDELFGGYNRYFAGPRIWNAVRRVPQPLRRRASPALRALAPRVSAALDRLAPVLPRRLVQLRPGEKLGKVASLLGARHPQALYAALASVWLAPDQLVLNAREPRTPLSDPDAWPENASLVELLMYLDLIIYLPTDILTKVDRAAMAVSLETRVPFLDHQVVEFAWRLPLDFKVKDGSGKWLLRQLLYRRVPRELLERPKMGFAIPVGRWVRGPLRGWAEELVNERRLAQEGYLDVPAVRDLWTKHITGRIDAQFPLWAVLMFQSWLDSIRRPAGVLDRRIA